MNVLYIFLICASRLTDILAQTITDEEIEAFVNGHNLRRARVAEGLVDGQPAATNMNGLQWDDELYTKAAAWAAGNEFEHNPDKTVPSGRFRTGENLYRYSTTNKSYNFNLEKAIEAWFIEHANYTFGPLQEEDFDGSKDYKIGHYTQLVWANSIYVGCAISNEVETTWNRFFVVCNYGPGGNYLGQEPYIPVEE